MNVIEDHCYYPIVRAIPNNVVLIENRCVTCGLSLSSSAHIHIRVTGSLRVAHFWGVEESTDMASRGRAQYKSKVTAKVIYDWYEHRRSLQFVTRLHQGK